MPIGKTYFTQQIERLQKSLYDEYTDDQVNLLWKNVKGFDVVPFQKAIDFFISSRTKQKGLPAVNEIWKEAYKYWMNTWTDKKQQERDEAKKFFKEQKADTEVAKDFMRIIMGQFSGNLTVEEVNERIVATCIKHNIPMDSIGINEKPMVQKELLNEDTCD